MTIEDAAAEIDVAWFRARLPPGDAWTRLSAKELVVELFGFARSRAPVLLEFVEGPDPSADPEVRQQFELAVRAAEALRQDQLPELKPEEIEALHAFMHLVARPALPVREGQLPTSNLAWPVLESEGDMIARTIRGVGRLDSFDGVALGTGWLAAPGLLVTNKHVVAALCGVSVNFNPTWPQEMAQRLPGHNARWKAKPALCPRWDVRDLPSLDAAPTGRVRQVRATHPNLDIALLDVDCAVDLKGAELRLSAAPPELADGQQVYAVGYPGVANARLHPALAKLLFGDGDGKSVCKRVAPGLLHAVMNGRVEHDCTTLGGNSGSAVIDLSTHRVLGLHFQGSYGITNHAVPLWTLRNDPFFVGTGIEFA